MTEKHQLHFGCKACYTKKFMATSTNIVLQQSQANYTLEVLFGDGHIICIYFGMNHAWVY